MDGKSFAVDAAALVVYALVANPAVTGIGLHEWASLGLLVVFFVHSAMRADWVVETVAGLARRPSPARVGNFVLDALTLVALMTVAVSGILVSGSVLPALGLYADGYYFWDPLHSISAKVLLVLLLVHVVAHWKWLYNFLRRGKAGAAHATRKTGEADERG